MKKYLIILIILSTHFSVKAQVSSDIDEQTLIVCLYDFPEFTNLLTQAYEHANNSEKLENRKNQVSTTSVPNNRQELGDTYGIAVDSKLVKWIGESIIKTVEKGYSGQYVFVENKEIDETSYPIKDFPYVLDMLFEFTPDNEPFQATLFFHIRNRSTNDQLEINTDLSRIDPFYYWASQRGNTPFYGTIKNSKFKKELKVLINELAAANNR